LDIAQDRELIPNGETGGLIIFNDQPTSWDAWETDIHHLQTPHPLEFTNIEVHENGPLRASLSSEVKYGQSKIAITISLDAITATLKADSRSFFRFDAKVDWHERHMFLKFEIPLNIHSPNATFETQFGNISRPTHRNTSWDIAKFEVCGHKVGEGHGLRKYTDMPIVILP
jgi:alpha-mannosidase